VRLQVKHLNKTTWRDIQFITRNRTDCRLMQKQTAHSRKRIVALFVESDFRCCKLSPWSGVVDGHAVSAAFCSSVLWPPH